jgi:1,4-dihydroxy-6-naphthoate synthase
MKYSLGFSPCPNDTFIFDALVNRKIDTGDLEFEIILEDVQTLNRYALENRLHISKISYGAYPLVMSHYKILSSGGALGKGVGPLLISKKPIPNFAMADYSVAIPGENTTAHMLFSLAFPHADKKKFMIFSEIENAVLSGEVDCGVIIHENRFTYEEKGLIKLMDLGEYWEKETTSPIPLGGIIIKRGIEKSIQEKVDDLIRESLEYSFRHYPFISDYVKQNSQEMDEVVMRQHIDLYVNNYSLNLGEDGKKAVLRFLDIYATNDKRGVADENVFVD